MLDVGYCQDDFQSFFQNLESLFPIDKTWKVGRKLSRLAATKVNYLLHFFQFVKTNCKKCCTDIFCSLALAD